MKTFKVYIFTASILLAGVGVASAKQGKEKAKKTETKAKGDKKGGSGANDIAVKKQGASSTGTTGAKTTPASPAGNK